MESFCRGTHRRPARGPQRRRRRDDPAPAPVAPAAATTPQRPSWPRCRSTPPGRPSRSSPPAPGSASPPPGRLCSRTRRRAPPPGSRAAGPASPTPGSPPPRQPRPPKARSPRPRARAARPTAGSWSSPTAPPKQAKQRRAPRRSRTAGNVAAIVQDADEASAALAVGDLPATLATLTSPVACSASLRSWTVFTCGWMWRPATGTECASMLSGSPGNGHDPAGAARIFRVAEAETFPSSPADWG
jgi:hypothetical protein